MCEREVTEVWPARPVYGSAMIASSKAGARYSHAQMVADKNDVETRVDVWVARKKYQVAQMPATQQPIGASFVRPTYGAFDAHESGCQPNVGVRETQWHVQRVQQGTRPEEDPKRQDRFIVKWPKYGDVGKKEVKYDIDLSCKTKGWWVSYAEGPSITKLLRAACSKLRTWRPTQ